MGRLFATYGEHLDSENHRTHIKWMYRYSEQFLPPQATKDCGTHVDQVLKEDCDPFYVDNWCCMRLVLYAIERETIANAKLMYD